MATVLIVEDQESVRATLCRQFTFRGHIVHPAATGEEAIDVGRRVHPHAMVADFALPGLGGPAAFAALRVEQPGVQGYGMSGVFGPEEGARLAEAVGMLAFFSKPFLPADLINLMEANLRPPGPSLSAKQTNKQTNKSDDRLKTAFVRPQGMIGDCAAMHDVYRRISRLAPLRVRVLITGETGTGKELVARAIHAASPRRDRAFVAVNCGAIPRELAEAEVFGSMPGAFTGAVARSGRFEEANSGTLFLDEIGELPPSAQAVLLRALDRGEVQRLGGNRTATVDVRVISATNRDLTDAIATGGFRRDLFHRLDETQIALPALRDRGGDLELLIDEFLPRLCATLGAGTRILSRTARERLLRCAWPGNVRELEHALIHAIIDAGDETIEVANLPPEVRGESGRPPCVVPPRPAGKGLTEAVSEVASTFEREWIRRELGRGRTRTDVARALRVNDRTLYEKLALHGLFGRDGPRDD